MKGIIILLSSIIILTSPIGMSNQLYHIDIRGNEEAEARHNPILFIHGWTKTKEDWNIMKEWFINDGWPESVLHAKNLTDTNNISIQAIINDAYTIKQWVDEILCNTCCKKIDIIGHSLGGISSRYYIKFLGGINYVDDYVSLGCDHHGNRRWVFDGTNTLIEILNEGDETPGGILNDTLGPRENPIWKEKGIIYNGSHIPGTIDYTSIYSLDDEYFAPISCKLDGANNIEVEGLGHSDLFKDLSVYNLVKGKVEDSHQISVPSLISPLGGNILSGNINVSWNTAIDTWCYEVKYNLSYSIDDGTTWILLKLNTTETYFIWDTQTAPDTSNCIFMIEAFSSGGLYSYFISSSMIISNPTTTTTSTSEDSKIVTSKSTSWNIVPMIISLSLLIYLNQLRKKA